MKKTSTPIRGTTVVTYGVFVCTNSVCPDGEFAAGVPPLYIDLPECPCCGCPSLLLDVLHRE